MNRAGAGSKKSKGGILDFLDALSYKGLLVGAAGFVAATAYFLWAVNSGNLSNFASQPVDFQSRMLGNLTMFGNVLVISGLLLVFSCAIRYYSHEFTGYVLLASGLLLYAGMPMMLAMVAGEPVGPIQLIINQFGQVGVTALVAAVPFVILDLWFKVVGRRASSSRKSAVLLSKGSSGGGNQIYSKCWEMPFCRNYMRNYCKSFKDKKSCWKTKSGCFCDEEMIVRALEQESKSMMAGADGAKAKRPPAKTFTPSQKRERCRNCRIYAEHQNQKYRILCPLAFILPIGFVWLEFASVNTWLHQALNWIDKFVARISVMPNPESDPQMRHFMDSISGSSVAQWVLIICFTMMAITWILRGLEFVIYSRQL